MHVYISEIYLVYILNICIYNINSMNINIDVNIFNICVCVYLYIDNKYT